MYVHPMGTLKGWMDTGNGHFFVFGLKSDGHSNGHSFLQCLCVLESNVACWWNVVPSLRGRFTFFLSGFILFFQKNRAPAITRQMTRTHYYLSKQFSFIFISYLVVLHHWSIVASTSLLLFIIFMTISSLYIDRTKNNYYFCHISGFILSIMIRT